MKRKTYERNRKLMPGFKQKPLRRKKMGKMSEIAMLLEQGDEKGLVEFFGKQGWRKSVSEIGGKEFLKAFDENKKEMEEYSEDIDEQSYAQGRKSSYDKFKVKDKNE